ncbi:transposable element Tcb2 transposase [Trichonephila clavipes]|nr:transposable element Tcb2 transposase [Trichonephila clavipes]
MTRLREESKVVGGQTRKITTVDDRYIVLHAKRARYQSASAIARQLCTATGRQGSQFTVARRLHKCGLFGRRPECCIPLKVGHRRHRLEWCENASQVAEIVNAVYGASSVTANYVQFWFR